MVGSSGNGKTLAAALLAASLAAGWATAGTARGPAETERFTTPLGPASLGAPAEHRPTPPPGAPAPQEAAAEVQAALEAAIAAWSEGDFDAFASHFHPDVRGFFMDGAPLARGLDVATLRMAHEAGVAVTVAVRDVDVRIYDRTAATVAYLEGSVGLPGGAGSIGGAWRYSDMRVREDGRWKVVQYHISQMGGGP